MDGTKLAIAVLAAVVAVVVILLGYQFINDHWEDIKSLFIIALALGGTFVVTIGGLKLRAGR
jgi:NAD/NADP transhydrogenase beta subunit